MAPVPADDHDKLRVILEHSQSLVTTAQAALRKWDAGFANEAMTARAALIDLADRIHDIADELPAFVP